MLGDALPELRQLVDKKSKNMGRRHEQHTLDALEQSEKVDLLHSSQDDFMTFSKNQTVRIKCANLYSLLSIGVHIE